MTKNKRLYLIMTTFFAMLIMAIADSTKGILIPTFKEVFGVSDTIIGTFLMTYSLTYVIMTYLGSLLCAHIGQKKTIVLGLFIAGTGFLITSFSTTFLHIILGYIISTIGIGIQVIGMNTIIPLLKVTYIGLLMNWLHFFYGVGSTLTQKVTGYLIYTGISWRMVFVGYFFLYMLAMFLYLFVTQPEESHEEKEAQKKPIRHRGLLVICCMALGFYAASEVQTANWMLNYLKEVKGMNTNTGATYIALFFGVFSIGRLLGGFVVEKIGYLKAIIISMSLALSLYTFGLVTGGNNLYIISLSGIFFAITYPTFLIVVQRIFVNNATFATAMVSMSASAVSMVVGYAMGILNDTVGPATTIYLIPLSMLICIILMIGIKRKIHKMVSNPTEPLMVEL
ncbi:MAG: MFS transporter [Clostridia bacterium]|nr:MFS transporter [Clostridia bacterium]